MIQILFCQYCHDTPGFFELDKLQGVSSSLVCFLIYISGDKRLLM